MMPRLLTKFLSLGVLLTLATCVDAEPTALQLQQRGFFFGRQYFMVRSQRLQWILQVDRADLGPAVAGYLWDADYIPQNSKHQAYNYSDDDGVRRSALEVISCKSGFAFTAYGQQTQARWIEESGIPAAEAVWWADGVQVSERFCGLAENNTVRRRISLRGANLYGDEQYKLRLRLPEGNAHTANRALWVAHRQCPQALVVGGAQPLAIHAEQGAIEIGPITVAPGQTVTVDTYMLALIPANTAAPGDFAKQIRRAVADSDKLLEATRDRWTLASRLESDDALLRDVFQNTRAVLPAIASDKGHVRVGPFQYAAEWVRDDSQFSLGLTATGQFDLARAVLEHCLRDMLTAQGTTMIGGGFADPNGEQFDQTGELLLALRWYVNFSGDTTLPAAYRDKLLALVERPLKFRDATGLVHNRREFWEQTMNDAYELSYNTYVIVGLREAAALATALGAEDRRARWLQEADAMQVALLKTLVDDGAFVKRRDVSGQIALRLVNPGGAPDVPSMNVREHRITPDATMALPMALGIVGPQSPLARRTLDEVEKLRDLRWSGGGYDRYDSTSEINTPGPWGIAAALILRGQHAAGLLDRSRRTLEWFRTVQGGDAGLYFEEIPLLAGSQQSWIGLVTWPSGEVPYFVVRHVLGVTFNDDAVLVRPQLFPNSPAVKADLRFRTGRLKLQIPGCGPYRSAEVNGRSVPVGADGALRLPADFAGGTVVFQRRNISASSSSGRPTTLETLPVSTWIQPRRS
jgi:hypothetical protein